MNARFYNSNTNRMITPDTIVPNPEDSQSYNRFAYVRNNPVNFNDPSGHRECDLEHNDCSAPEEYEPQPLVFQPLKTFTDQELDYIAVALLAENDWGTHSPEAMALMARVWINRAAEGEIFSGIDSGGATGCPEGADRCGAWYGIIGAWLDPGTTYANATSEQREAALQRAIDCYRTSGCSRREANFENVRAIVEDVYTNYRSYGPDPTNGSFQYAHQSTVRYNSDGEIAFEYANGQALYDALSANFESYQQSHPEFRYAVSAPYNAPYPDGTKAYVLVTGTWESCVVYGSCGN